MGEIWLPENMEVPFPFHRGWTVRRVKSVGRYLALSVLSMAVEQKTKNKSHDISNVWELWLDQIKMCFFTFSWQATSHVEYRSYEITMKSHEIPWVIMKIITFMILKPWKSQESPLNHQEMHNVFCYPTYHHQSFSPSAVLWTRGSSLGVGGLEWQSSHRSPWQRRGGQRSDFLVDRWPPSIPKRSCPIFWGNYHLVMTNIAMV